MKKIIAALLVALPLASMAGGHGYDGGQDVNFEQATDANAIATINMIGGCGGGDCKGESSGDPIAPMHTHSRPSLSTPGIYDNYKPALAISGQRLLHIFEAELGSLRNVYEVEQELASQGKKDPYEVYLIPWQQQAVEVGKSSGYDSACHDRQDWWNCESSTTSVQPQTSVMGRRAFYGFAPGKRSYLPWGTVTVKCGDDSGKCANVTGRAKGAALRWVDAEYGSVYIVPWLGGNMGVLGDANNAGLSIDLSRIFTGIPLTVGAGGGGTWQDGTTKPTLGYVGGTFMVLVEDNRGAALDLTEVWQTLDPAAAKRDELRKKRFVNGNGPAKLIREPSPDDEGDAITAPPLNEEAVAPAKPAYVPKLSGAAWSTRELSPDDCCKLK